MSAVIAGVVVAAAATGYSIYSAEQAKSQAKEQNKKLETDAKNRAGIEEASGVRDQAAQKQRRAASQNRSGTMLTSPLGTFASNLTDTSSGKSLIGQ